MIVDIDLQVLIDCADRHWDFMREYRLTGDVKYLKGFVLDVIREIADDEKSNKEIVDKFMSSITSREYLALVGIAEEIGDEGNISIVKMIQKIGCSRPVFTSVLTKLTNHHIAIVENQGVKGTHIKFIIPPEEIIDGYGK